MATKHRLAGFRSFWTFPLLALVLLYSAKRAEPDHSFYELLWLIPIGLGLWTLLEYGLHRFAFHIEKRDSKLVEMLSGSHLNHHAAPRDPDQLFANTTTAILVSAVLWSSLRFGSGSYFAPAGIMTGIWMGFLYYEWVHYRVHLTASNTGLIARQRRAHFHHHFTNQERCFGVTTPIWDHVFGTWRR